MSPSYSFLMLISIASRLQGQKGEMCIFDQVNGEKKNEQDE